MACATKCPLAWDYLCQEKKRKAKVKHNTYKLLKLSNCLNILTLEFSVVYAFLFFLPQKLKMLTNISRCIGQLPWDNPCPSKAPHQQRVTVPVTPGAVFGRTMAPDSANTAALPSCSPKRECSWVQFQLTTPDVLQGRIYMARPFTQASPRELSCVWSLRQPAFLNTTPLSSLRFPT